VIQCLRKINHCRVYSIAFAWESNSEAITLEGAIVIGKKLMAIESKMTLSTDCNCFTILTIIINYYLSTNCDCFTIFIIIINYNCLLTKS